jgi:hypothetical protein
MTSLFMHSDAQTSECRVLPKETTSQKHFLDLTLLGLGLIKINTVSANFTNPRPSLILNNLLHK